MSPPSEQRRSFSAISLDLNNIDTSCVDPRVVAMLSDGWDVRASLPIQREDRQEWLLLMGKGASQSALQADHKKMKRDLSIVAFSSVVQATCLLVIAIATIHSLL